VIVTAHAEDDYVEKLKKLLTPISEMPPELTLEQLLERERARTGLAYVVVPVAKEDE
jgi:hypothetical protein